MSHSLGLTLLHFADNVFIVYTLRFVATLHLASPVVPFIQKHLLTSFLCDSLAISAIYQAFSPLLYVLWWSVISYYCENIPTCWRCRCWLMFFSSIFQLQYLYYFLRHNAFAHLIDYKYSVKWHLYVLGKQEIRVSDFVVLFPSLLWSGTKATVSPSRAVYMSSLSMHPWRDSEVVSLSGYCTSCCSEYAVNMQWIWVDLVLKCLAPLSCLRTLDGVGISWVRRRSGRTMVFHHSR